MSTDPTPEQTPGLEPGNSVRPGDTPPAESSASGAVDHQPKLPGRKTNVIVYGAVIAVALLVVVMLVGYIVGIAD